MPAALAHRYPDGDAFPICHANSLNRPDVVANVHTHRNTGIDSHTFAHPGGAWPDRHVHGDIHAHPECHVDTDANVDACADIDVDTRVDAVSYRHHGACAHVDADGIAQFDAPTHLNSDRAARCHPHAVPHCQQLRHRSRANSRAGKRITRLHAADNCEIC